MPSPPYPPPLPPARLAHLLAETTGWSLGHGLAVRPSAAELGGADGDGEGRGEALAVVAPIALFPSLFPRRAFEEARRVQTAFNRLYVAVARDEGWLGAVVGGLLDVDDFIAELWKVHLAVKEEGYVQNLSLGLFRSDYMLHLDPRHPSVTPQIKQVEFNTIASSFGGLSSQVSRLHRYLLQSAAYPPHPSLTPSALPHNPSLAALSDGLAAAHRAYGSSKSDPQLPTCILFIVQPDEHNIFDQRLLSLRLTETNQIPTFRLPFPLVTAHTSIPPANPSRPLIYHPPHSPSTHYEVSTLYFRSAYTPTDYAHPTAWPSRLHLERSASIKCPSILTHLAGSKKVQQVLATPGAPHLDRFLPSAPDDAAGLARTFAAIYPLDSSPAGETAKALAMDPERAVRFVLKPQREGGGNNVYGRNIPGFLQGMGGEEGWKGHILMELIEPPVLTNSIFREGKVIAGEVVGELGVYGAVLWDHKGGKVLLNEEAGWLLRTKGRESEEGGVAAGFGCVDSVCLVGD